jgi:TldD protein
MATSPQPVRISPATVGKDRKVEVLARADAAARAEGAAIKQVSAGYADSRREILVANSDGLLAGDEQVRTRFVVSCVAAGDTGMQTASEAPGRTVGFELFDSVQPEEVARTAARRALTLLSARPAPSGRLPVVLKRGAGGVLFHEACGHGLEADLVRKDASVFKGRVGEQVASSLVTLVDDGTYDREWGTFAIDDEGQPARRNVLIENGVLTDYMWDLVRARQAGRGSSGNGRRETYQHLPMVRMTNTYLLEGATDPAAIIADTARGIYCVQLGGGQVNTATGDFVFGITEAYLIEHGEITEPIQQAQLIGNGPNALTLVDAVGDDFDTWTGTCGKSGQGVPVSSGQPTLRVAELTIGGTAG